MVVESQGEQFLLKRREQFPVLFRGKAALEIHIAVFQCQLHSLRVLIAVPQVIDNSFSPILSRHHRQIMQGLIPVPGAVPDDNRHSLLFQDQKSRDNLADMVNVGGQHYVDAVHGHAPFSSQGKGRPFRTDCFR